MVPTIARELGRLESVDRHVRRARVQLLLGQGLISANGTTLFRYHVTGRFYESRDGEDVPMEQAEAEFESGVSWALLNAQQKQFWVGQTENLLAGSTSPLDYKTFDDFSVHCINLPEGDSTGQERDKPPESQLPTPKSCKSAAHSAASVTSETTRSSDASDEFCEAPPEPLAPTADEPESIEDYCLLLATGSRRVVKSTKPHLFAGLDNKFSADGLTLFLYHASVWASQEVAESQGMEEAAVLMLSAWHTMEEHERSWWAGRTTVIKHFLTARERSFMKHLERDVEFPEARLYAEKALTALGLELDDDMGSEDRVPVEHAVKTPILDFLYGGATARVGRHTVIDKLLATIRNLFGRNPGLHLQGRYKGVRISYKPLVVDVTSINSRLRLALRIEDEDGGYYPISSIVLSSDPVYQRFEYLLHPLVAWNPSVFPRFAGVKATMNSTTGWGYKSRWDPLQSQLAGLRPIMHAKRDEVIQAVMSAIRKRAEAAVSPRMYCM